MPVACQAPCGLDRCGGGAYLQFLKEGFFFKTARETATVRNLPDYYQVAFHSRRYIEHTWSQFFDIRAYVKHGPLYSQELAVLVKGPATNWNSYPVLDFPIAAFDSPRPASVIDEFYLEISGWAFYPRREAPKLWIWLDGALLGTSSADIPRGDVGAVFYSHETAQAPGFYKSVPIRHLNKGEHLLWLSLENSWFPLCATYFVVRFNPWVRAYTRSVASYRKVMEEIKLGMVWLRMKVRVRTRLKRR